ncbi:DUF3318 domain-containing protein [Phormidesmis priestleyi]
MMNPELELRRLLDIMPASGRMFTKLVSKPEQRSVIDAPFPMPWTRDRSISINFDFWSRLSRPQRDLLLLRMVGWLGAVKWLKPNVNLGLVAAGALGVGVEVVQHDFVGVAAASALSAIALSQIWRSNRSSRIELDADETALKVAQRRGYSETEAARSLLSAIELVAQLEGRGLSFTELMRMQALKAIAGFSPVGVPEEIRRESL